MLVALIKYLIDLTQERKALPQRVQVVGSWPLWLGRTPWWWEYEADESLTSWRKQSRESKEGTRNHVKTACDPLPPTAKPHLLKFPASSRTAAPAVAVTFHKSLLGNITLSNHHTLLIVVWP